MQRRACPCCFGRCWILRLSTALQFLASGKLRRRDKGCCRDKTLRRWDIATTIVACMNNSDWYSGMNFQPFLSRWKATYLKGKLSHLSHHDTHIGVRRKYSGLMKII